MLTFSFNKQSMGGGADQYCARVWKSINSNAKYFKHFNNADWEEAQHVAYLFALENRKDRYDDLDPYIKKLARTVMKRKKKKELIAPLQNEDGEISVSFLSLSETIDISTIDGLGELLDEFKLLYLTDSESFERLRTIFDVDDEKSLRASKDLRLRNKELKSALMRMSNKYGADVTYATLKHFYEILPTLTTPSLEQGIKTVVLKPSRKSIIDMIPDTPTIKDEFGNFHYIDRNTLTMARNPDYFKWDILGTTSSDVLKLDISPFIDYVYCEVFVPQGVNTRFIQWCGDFQRLTTPSGESFINLDQEKFVSRVRVELISILMVSGLGSIVAISPDFIYFKPSRSFNCNSVRLETHYGKNFDLPVSVHLVKRKRKR